MNTVYGSNQSCYDFDDDVDELFNLAIFLIDNNPLLVTNMVQYFLIFFSEHQCTRFLRVCLFGGTFSRL